MTVLVRQRTWRRELTAWATDIRGKPYVWGTTDCSTLAREALRLQFGADVFPTILQWSSLREALCVLKTIEVEGGLSVLFAKMGAREIIGRKYHWPVGTILIKDEGTHLPALSISMGEFVIDSDKESGVQWCEPAATVPLVKKAWLFEQLCVEGATNG